MEDTIDDLAATLRSQLSSTELVLAKFNEAVRKRLIELISQTPSGDTDRLALICKGIDMGLQTQTDFARMKAYLEVTLGLVRVSIQGTAPGQA